MKNCQASKETTVWHWFQLSFFVSFQQLNYPIFSQNPSKWSQSCLTRNRDSSQRLSLLISLIIFLCISIYCCYKYLLFPKRNLTVQEVSPKLCNQFRLTPVPGRFLFTIYFQRFAAAFLLRTENDTLTSSVFCTFRTQLKARWNFHEGKSERNRLSN